MLSFEGFDVQLRDRPAPATPRADRPPFLRNAWYVAMWSADLAPGAVELRTIVGDAVALFREPGGAVHALQDRCPHRFAPLSRGAVMPDGRLRCGYHGLEFDGAGACAYNPHGNHNVPPAARVRAYPAVDRHSCVWVWMGDRAPDPATIPDFSILDRTPEPFVAKRDWIRVNAGYRLVVDNLLDLSHVSYLHDGILGNAEMVDSEIHVDEDGDTVIVGRSSEGTPIPGLFEMFWPHESKRVDKWNRIRWTAPSNMLLYSGVCRPGAPRESGTGYYGVHLLTPETETTTLYHFTAARWNVLTDGDDRNREIREKLSSGRRYAFADQDVPMIEAQQRTIQASDDAPRPALLAIDVGPVKYGRILDRLIDRDATVAE